MSVSWELTLVILMLSVSTYLKASTVYVTSVLLDIRANSLQVYHQWKDHMKLSVA